MQMPGTFTTRTVVVSSDPSAAATRGTCRRPAAPAKATLLMNRRRVCVIGIGNLPVLLCSRLQLAFELVQEAPIGAVGNDPLRSGLDQTGFAQAKRVPPNRVLGIELSPLVIVVRQCLSDIVGSRNATAVGEASRDARGVRGAYIRRLQNRAQHRSGRVRVRPDVIRKTGQHAAEILRPWPVDDSVDEHMPDVRGT